MSVISHATWKKHSSEWKYKGASKDCRRHCGFKDVHNLDYHMRTIHSACMEHRCYICDDCFLNEKGLKRHLKVEHHEWTFVKELQLTFPGFPQDRVSCAM